MTRRQVAVIGSGVAGLTAAYVLQRECDVTLFEAQERLGGHAHTHELVGGGGRVVGVDSGFIVHNERTYPTLLRLFEELGVPTQESEMSMSVRCEGCGLEYAGARGLGGLLAAGGRRGAYLRMLAEVPRFHRQARRLLREGDPAAVTTLREFLRAGRYSRYFISHFMTPLVSAVWSCAPTASGDYPVRYLCEFLANHGLLSVTGSPSWRTVTGGSATYVERAAKELSAVALSTPVRALTRTGTGVAIRDDADTVRAFDAAVVATHPDQALGLLAAPTPTETQVLGAFRYSRNSTVLHTDTSLLPRRPAAAASWNYLLEGCEASAAQVLVSYDMNRLQRLDPGTRYVVTLGGGTRIRPDRVVAEMVYEHPVYTPASVAAGRRLPELSDDRISYAGAYHGWGFHEDGCRSGVEAARSLGVRW